MAELIDVANAMFTNKRNWVNISDEDKEKAFRGVALGLTERIQHLASLPLDLLIITRCFLLGD